MDNASILNACDLLAGGPLTAVADHDLAAVVQALMIGERLETLSGHSYEAIMRRQTSEAWDISNPGNLYASLRDQGLLSLKILDASWHNDQLERRDEIDAYVSSLDLDEIAASLTLDDVSDWRALVFGREMLANDSNPIYAAPPREAKQPLALGDRRLEPADLFVSQTLLYCWYANAGDRLLMVSALRRRIATAATEGTTKVSRSALVAGCHLLADADAEFTRSVAEAFQ